MIALHNAPKNLDFPPRIKVPYFVVDGCKIQRWTKGISFALQVRGHESLACVIDLPVGSPRHPMDWLQLLYPNLLLSETRKICEKHSLFSLKINHRPTFTISKPKPGLVGVWPFWQTVIRNLTVYIYINIWIKSAFIYICMDYFFLNISTFSYWVRFVCLNCFLVSSVDF